MGIEKTQTQTIEALFSGNALDAALRDKLRISAVLKGGKTPNQKALACAVALMAARLKVGTVTAAQAFYMTGKLFEMMKAGHQATGERFANEQGACDPHAELWAVAMATIFRESILAGKGDLTSSALAYWGAHLRLIQTFWTPSGYRTPCARAKTSPGQALVPSWTLDSSLYVWVYGGGNAHGIGNPSSRLAQRILAASGPIGFAEMELRQAAMKARVHLAVPVIFWRKASGGFIACFSEETPMNDPCSWIEVDGQGAILGAGRTLEDFKKPAEPSTMIVGLG